MASIVLTLNDSHIHRKGERECERANLVISICTIIILSGCISIADFYGLVSKSVFRLLFTTCTMYFYERLQLHWSESRDWRVTTNEEREREFEWVNEWNFDIGSVLHRDFVFANFLSLRAIFHLLHLFHLAYCILQCFFNAVATKCTYCFWNEFIFGLRVLNSLQANASINSYVIFNNMYAYVEIMRDA